MKKLLLFALAISIHATVFAAESFSTLEERMTGKEFKETGLGNLSDEELAALNEWIRSHSVATLANAVPRSATSSGAAAYAGAVTDMRGFENQPKDGKIIRNNIVGSFNGWTGDTMFTLANGMIWKQVEGDTFYIQVVENPEIIIRRGVMGGWRLSIVGYNNTVRVKRIQ